MGPACPWPFRSKHINENSRHFATSPLVSPRNDVWKTSTEIRSKRLVTVPHAIPFFFLLLQTRPGRTLTQKGSLESVVFHVPVFFLVVRMGLCGGRFVRLVGKHAFRLSRMENAVLSGWRNWFQSGREVWTSNFIADDDTLLNVKFCLNE